MVDYIDNIRRDILTRLSQKKKSQLGHLKFIQPTKCSAQLYREGGEGTVGFSFFRQLGEWG